MADLVVGLDVLVRSLSALPSAIHAAAGRALREEGERIMTNAKQRTPVATGALRASGHVTGPDADTSVHLIFGGPAADYAVYVHERLGVHHPNGEAKFLEHAVLEAERDLGARLATRIAGLVK